VVHTQDDGAEVLGSDAHLKGTMTVKASTL
jgi:hypothetical protein